MVLKMLRKEIETIYKMYDSRFCTDDEAINMMLKAVELYSRVNEPIKGKITLKKIAEKIQKIIDSRIRTDGYSDKGWQIMDNKDNEQIIENIENILGHPLFFNREVTALAIVFEKLRVVDNDGKIGGNFYV